MDLGPPPILVTVRLAGAAGKDERDYGRHSVDLIPVVGHEFSAELDGAMVHLRAISIEKGDHDVPVVHAERVAPA